MGDAAVPGSGSDNRVAVRLLGEAAVVVGGVATRIAAAKERTVLAALALAGGSPVHVDTLTDALWDDDPPATAPKTLQNYVARLRRATGAEALRRVGDAYVLAVRPEDVDLLDVERLVRATRTHVLAGRARSADVTLRAAREQWRAVVDVGDGTHFTAGLASRVAALDLDLTEVAAEVDLGVGRDPTAELLRAVDTAPERERLWTLLVRALDVAGRQADALRAYQRARDALADVGLEPGAALRAAEAAALGERPTVGAGAVVTSLPAWLDAPAVLAGRTDVLATLDAAWSDVIGGERAVVTLGGEPGAGKTSLLAHVARRAIDAGGVVLAATASHRASQAGELVADAFAGLGAASIDELVDATAANVEPALVDRLHQELAGACAGTLARIVVDRPALVILDDVQWTDSLSAHVVARLLAILPARTFVLVAARPDGGDAAAVVSLRAALARFGRHLDVAPLDLDALGDIAEASGAPRSVAAALHERTGGNALLASELLAHGDVGGMPPSIDAIVRDRLLQLDEGDRLTVDLAAIAGPDVDARLLAEVRGQPIDAIVDALERAAAAGIVVRSTGTAGYRFPHHLTWSAVVAAIPRLAAARHHDELGRALDERAAPPALVAEHLLAAGDAGDVLVAIDAARRAAAAAMTAGALDDAAAWFRRARLALDAGAPHAVLRTELAVAEASAIDLGGHLATARIALLEAAQDASADTPAAVLVDMAAIYAGAPGALLDPHDVAGRALVDRAAAALGPGDDDLRCVLLAVEACWRAGEVDPAPRTALADEALAIARRLDDATLLARALGTAWATGQGVRHPSEQLLLTEEWCSLAGRDDPSGASALLPLVRSWPELVALGRLADAAEVAREVASVAARSRWTTARWYSAILRGFHACMSGDLDRAEDALAAAEIEPLGGAFGPSVVLATLRSAVAELAGRDPLLALEEVAASVPPAAEMFAIDARRALTAGRRSEAREHYAAWFERIVRRPTAMRPRALAGAAAGAALGADEDVLRGMLAELTPLGDRWIAGTLSMPYGRTELATGILRTALGDLDGAVDDLAAAHAAHVAAGAHGIAAASGDALRAALVARGRPGDRALVASLV